MSYDKSHMGRERGKIYDERYRQGFTAALWERVERPLLEEIFARVGGEGKSCLDFACGTGRITQLLTPHFAEVVGVDISGDMLAQAARKCPDARFIEGDLIGDPEIVGQFDVVTSFRFFPNAEPELRTRAMNALVSRLKPGGMAVFNNHQNARSLLGVLRRIKGSHRKFMFPEEMEELLAGNGLQIAERIGFGRIPVWRDWSFVPARRLANLEAGWIARDGKTGRELNIVYIAQKG